MLDHALEAAFVDLLKADETFAGTHLYTGHEDARHELPAITFSARSEPLAGSSEVFRAELTVTIESQANDTPPADHAARVEAVRAKLAQKNSAIAAINAANAVHLYGYCASQTDPSVEATNFKSPLTYKVGYGAP